MAKTKAKKKGGRPRKEGLREKNGRIARTPRAARDEGTAQNKARREWLVQSGNPAMASFPLGILRENRSITGPQFLAGGRYAWLFRMAVGRKPTVAAVRYEELMGQELYPDTEKREDLVRKAKREYEEAAAVLETLRMKAAVDGVTIYENMPGIIEPRIPTQGEIAEAEAIVRGLGVLAAVFGLTRSTDQIDACLVRARKLLAQRQEVPEGVKEKIAMRETG